ncbi:hypothetical protein [Paractinoplanes lichenicola]|uniref:Uncharacterized protein n=1 Tax=Paractinoplanes lichenicola TaxID=2802976 RepID=A0ABS1VHQ6_9ACTN|nr:hypothetical protein [Actinoplanes lichenicola]MBL7254016.1 hypothetical protein [Actinoplanes lichenicola]
MSDLSSRLAVRLIGTHPAGERLLFRVRPAETWAMVRKSIAGMTLALTASGVVLGLGAPAQAAQATTTHSFSHVYGPVHNFATDFEVTNYGSDISLSVESYSTADRMSCTSTIVKGGKTVRTLGKLIHDEQNGVYTDWYKYVDLKKGTYKARVTCKVGKEKATMTSKAFTLKR